MKLVIKIGGSLLFDEQNDFHIERLKQYAKLIRKIVEHGNQISLVVGGGILAKQLIGVGSQFSANKESLDQLGIAATWVNAQLMITALGELAFPVPFMNFDNLLDLWDKKKIPVFGGLQPGQSTNAVAAHIAKRINADVLLNVTDVDGVYDRDPSSSKSAKLIPVITVNQLRHIISSLSSEPGTYPLFDKRALSIIEQARIEVWFVNGTDPENILRAIMQKKIGTQLVHK